jgi:DNA-binding PadR family transcriptional regulator
MKREVCDMRGFLSFLILFLLSKKQMSGSQLAEELGKRKGCKPTPGTIYPALKELVSKNAIEVKSKSGKEKIYALTKFGRGELAVARNAFCKAFYDLFMK